MIPGCGRASPSISVSSPAMILSSVDLPAPFKPSTPILAPGKEAQGDIAQDDALRGYHLGYPVHRVDVLGHVAKNLVRGAGKKAAHYPPTPCVRLPRPLGESCNSDGAVNALTGGARRRRKDRALRVRRRASVRLRPSRCVHARAEGGGAGRRPCGSSSLAPRRARSSPPFTRPPTSTWWWSAPPSGRAISMPATPRPTAAYSKRPATWSARR